MGPGNLKFGGGAGATMIHPVVLVLMLLTTGLIFLLPRKYVVVPFLLTIFLTPFGEQIYVGGVHLFVPRILILFGFIRVLWTKMASRTEVASGGFNSVDQVFALWALISASAISLQFMQGQALLNQCGFLWDALGGYFFLRFLIRDQEDLLRVIKTFAIITCVLSITMIGEKFLHLNVFGYIGGRLATWDREGAIRSTGTFEGPIPSGTFAATLMCLFALLWQSGRARLFAVAGAIGATIMVVTSASSTPLLTYGAAIIGISMWPLRKKMRAIRWGIIIALISLQLVMKAPVWFLINHVDLVAGNSGYHRAELIDQCVRHFSDWWLIGVKDTSSWGWDMWDQANQFTAVADSSGLAALICFILMVSRSFGRIGSARKIIDGDRKQEWMLWLLGATLFSHVVAFFGISYNDQANTNWYVFLCLISAGTASILAKDKVAEKTPELQLARPSGAYSSQPVSVGTKRRLPAALRS